MLQNEPLVAKIGLDTAENVRRKGLQKRLPFKRSTCSPRWRRGARGAGDAHERRQGKRARLIERR